MGENHRRKKQPQRVRAQLLDAAQSIALEKGLNHISLDTVARLAGISKGGLVHHFPTRQALIRGLFSKLLAEFAAGLGALAAADSDPRGRFTRAYLKATVESTGTALDSRLLGAFTLILGSDAVLAAEWNDWLLAQLESHGESVGSLIGRMIRYAADGMWLEECTRGISDPERRQAVIQHLLELTYIL